MLVQPSQHERQIRYPLRQTEQLNAILLANDLEVFSVLILQLISDARDYGILAALQSAGVRKQGAQRLDCRDPFF